MHQHIFFKQPYRAAITPNVDTINTIKIYIRTNKSNHHKVESEPVMHKRPVSKKKNRPIRMQNMMEQVHTAPLCYSLTRNKKSWCCFIKHIGIMCGLCSRAAIASSGILVRVTQSDPARKKREQGSSQMCGCSNFANHTYRGIRSTRRH